MRTGNGDDVVVGFAGDGERGAVIGRQLGPLGHFLEPAEVLEDAVGIAAVHLAAVVTRENTLVEVQGGGHGRVDDADAADGRGADEVHVGADVLDRVVVAVSRGVGGRLRDLARSELAGHVVHEVFREAVAHVPDDLAILLLVVGDGVEMRGAERHLGVLVDSDIDVSEQVADVRRAVLITALGGIVLRHGRHLGDVTGVGLVQLQAVGRELRRHLVDAGNASGESVHDILEDLIDGKGRIRHDKRGSGILEE